MLRLFPPLPPDAIPPPVPADPLDPPGAPPFCINIPVEELHAIQRAAQPRAKARLDFDDCDESGLLVCITSSLETWESSDLRIADGSFRNAQV
jgi:hypothetical protein